MSQGEFIAKLVAAAWDRYSQLCHWQSIEHESVAEGFFTEGFEEGYREGREGTLIGALDAHEIASIVELGTGTDCAHHKQWALAQIGAMVGVLVEDQGIAP